MFQKSNAESGEKTAEPDANALDRKGSSSRNDWDGSGDGHIESTQHESEELTQQSNANNSASKTAPTISKDIWGLLRRVGGKQEEFELCHRMKDFKRDTYTIGRSSKCDITVPDTWVSTNHCSIYCDYTQAKLRIFIEDSSANGTFINDSLTRLRKGERMELKSGDQIFLLNPRKVETEGKKFATFTYINLRERLVAVREISFAPSRSVTVTNHLMLSPSTPQLPWSSGAAGTAITTTAVTSAAAATAGARNSSQLTSQHSSLSSQNSQRYALHIEDKYIIGDQIGSGMSGQVYLCVNKSTLEHFAVKMIDTRKFSLTPGLSVSDLREEAIMMRQFDHPNIIKVVDTFQSESMIYIVMELLRGGDLFDRIIEKERYGEESARQLMIQVLSAVEYLHERQIIHRDLKPENILLVSTKSDVQVKVTDFGLAKKANSAGLKTFCGTPQYFAPEVLKRKNNVQSQGRYGAAVDMWSLGVVLYILLSGSFPFSDDEEILRADYSLAGMEWEGISTGAKHLIGSLMTLQVEHRYTVQQALKHPWICGVTHIPGKIQQVPAVKNSVAAAPDAAPSSCASANSAKGAMEVCDKEMCVDDDAEDAETRMKTADISASTHPVSAIQSQATVAPTSTATGKKRQASTTAGATTSLTRKQSSVSSKKANLRRGASIFKPLELKFKSSMEYVSCSSNLVMLHTSLPAAITDVLSEDSVFNTSSTAAPSSASALSYVTALSAGVVAPMPPVISAPAIAPVKAAAVKTEPAAVRSVPKQLSATVSLRSTPSTSTPLLLPVVPLAESPEQYIDLLSNTFSSTVTIPTANAAIVHLTVTNEVSFMDNLRQPLRTLPAPTSTHVVAPPTAAIAAAALIAVSLPVAPSNNGGFKRSQSFSDSTSYNTHANKIPAESVIIPSMSAASALKTLDMGSKVLKMNKLAGSIDPYDDAIEDYSSEDDINAHTANYKQDGDRQHRRRKKAPTATLGSVAATAVVVKAVKSSGKPPLPSAAGVPRGCMKKSKPAGAGEGYSSACGAHSSAQALAQQQAGASNTTTAMPSMSAPLQRKRSVSFCERLEVVDVVDVAEMDMGMETDIPPGSTSLGAGGESTGPSVSALVTPDEAAANSAKQGKERGGGKVFTFDTGLEGLHIDHITLSSKGPHAPVGDAPRVVTPSNHARTPTASTTAYTPQPPAAVVATVSAGGGAKKTTISAAAVGATSSSSGSNTKATIGIKRTQSSLEQAWKIKVPAAVSGAGAGAACAASCAVASECTVASDANYGSASKLARRGNENVINASSSVSGVGGSVGGGLSKSAHETDSGVQVGKKLRVPMKSLSELFRVNSTTSK